VVELIQMNAPIERGRTFDISHKIVTPDPQSFVIAPVTLLFI
jgi:hypothetical protein